MIYCYLLDLSYYTVILTYKNLRDEKTPLLLHFLMQARFREALSRLVYVTSNPTW